MANEQVLPAFPYGAVYFRKSNPPRQDWARDYRTAAADGMNAFRHWFMWSAIEVAPGEFDWADYDRQLDLAAENGLKTVIAEMITAAPEWAFRRLGHARLERFDGRKLDSRMGGSSATGGFPGLCLDNDDARGLAEHFLRELVGRYRNHPGLGGYDIWNECNYPADCCYCPATAEQFRTWLQAKYGDLKTLGEAWYRFSFAEWADVVPPRERGPYPDTLDWLQFRIDNAYRLMRWRAQLIRELDSNHPVTAHGVALTLLNHAENGCDEWRAAAEVDSYGFTWIASRKGNEPWKHWHAVDLVRAGSRGKPFWHAEAQAGPLWMQPQVTGRPREDGRIAEPEDVRLWNLISFAGGATGMLYPRWRPLLDGPLFGAFGAYGMDGSRTPRSEMVSRLATWATAPDQSALWAARPIRGDIGIVVVPESQLFCYAQQGKSDLYARAARGAYAGFFENNVQADWVHPSDIDQYRLLYLPFPIMLDTATASLLKDWVAAGGTLIAEGCPGYFGDRGRVGTVQPNLGLDEVFGVRESYVEFTPDLLDDLSFTIEGRSVRGGGFFQKYVTRGGTAVGWYADGAIAAVDHRFGRGRTRLIGTFPGLGYSNQPTTEARHFFASLLEFGGQVRHVRLDEPGVAARLHVSDDATYLWVINHNREPRRVALEISSTFGQSQPTAIVWGDGEPVVRDRSITLSVGGRDATIVRLM